MWGRAAHAGHRSRRGSVFAFDADAEAVEGARRSLPAELAERVAFGVATAQEIQLESRSFDLARGVERELVAGVEVDDAHMVAQRIEATDLLPATLTLHQKPKRGKGKNARSNYYVSIK
jgi:hypothetical protein